ncbi:MAG: saccharopine dehydrogenase NADP-binding domain-containing protein [Actinobacteria bacterium]|nr:saccharopine dehydrogenase NADP-binding domain-containing protein [Actinomycetota bacterium]
MKVLVVGATGAVGRRVASELAQSEQVERLVLTGRDNGRAERTASLFGTDRVTAEALDLHDPSRLVSLARAVDVVVCAAGPHYLYEVDAVRALIDAGTHYVSLCDDHSVTHRVRSMHDAARDAGVTIVSGCGLSPGLTNVLIAIAAAEVDDVEEIDIAVAASSADSAGDATTLHFLAQMSEPAVALSDHSIEAGRAGTAPRLVYFPDPVGWVETFRSGHPEIATVPDVYPGLRSLRFRIGLTERAAMDVIRASAATGLLATEKRRRLWMKMSEPLRPVVEALPPRGAPWTAARVDVRGRSDGRPVTISLGVVDHLANLAAVPVARAAHELAAGTTKHGVLVPEEAFDPTTFLNAIAQRGIRVARLDPAPV